VATQAEISDSDSFSHLASYRRCVERISGSWQGFVTRRSERLRQGLFGAPVEKVAENILEDLFTKVLDWNLEDVNLQVGRADIVLSELGIKRLVLEVKRPGSLAWHRRAVSSVLDQAQRYSASQKVGAVAVSDGQMLYAADVEHGGLRDRLFVHLDAADPPLELWWLSATASTGRVRSRASSFPRSLLQPQKASRPHRPTRSCFTTSTRSPRAASPMWGPQTW
jgi:hypothetical protein